jgi:hypothetical protein
MRRVEAPDEIFGGVVVDFPNEVYLHIVLYRVYLRVIQTRQLIKLFAGRANSNPNSLIVKFFFAFNLFWGFRFLALPFCVYNSVVLWFNASLGCGLPAVS